MKQNYISILITSKDLDKRVDVIIAQKLKDLSRNRLQQLITNGNLKFNDTIITQPSIKLKKLGELILEIPKPKKYSLIPQNLELDIIQFLDEINKDTLKIIKLGNMLPNLIRNFLIDKIISDISLEQDIYDKEIKKFYSKNNISNKKDLDNILKTKGISEEELHYQIILPLKVSKFAQQNFKNEIESYFLERKDFLDEYTFNIIRLKNKDLGEELADVLFVILCLANQTGVDLQTAFDKKLDLKTKRDHQRHHNNNKLK